MKRLCIVADTYPPKKDGVITFLRHIIPYLREHFKITLVAPAFCTDKNALVEGIDTVLTRYIPVELANYYPALPSARVIRAIKRSDIVFVHDLAPLGSAAINVARLMGKPIAVFCHHDEANMLLQAFKLHNRRLIPKRGFVSLVDRIVKKHYTAVDVFFVATSRFRDKLLRLGVPPEKIVFAPFGIDTERFKPGKNIKLRRKFGIPEDAPVLLYLGRMSHEKNVETIIRAIPLIAEKHPEAWFVLAGGGARLQEYKKLAKELAPNANVLFPGWVEWEETPEYYSMADIFLFPSLHETQAFVAMEAMACGLAVVASRDNHTHTYYREGENCLFVEDPLSEEELAEKACLLIENSELREKLGRSARETMKEYTWDSHAIKVVSSLKSIRKESMPKRRIARSLIVNRYTGAIALAYALRKML